MARMAKTRLKISCLPPIIKDDYFESLFVSVGQLVTCRVVRDENTGLCVGSGYVEYETEYDAEDAIKMLNGKAVYNKCIKVAHLLTDDKAPSTRLQVENLPTWCTFSTLGLKFSAFGEVLGCHTNTDPLTGLPNGVGFVKFGSKDEAVRAKNCLTGTVLEGASMPLAISFVGSQYDAEDYYSGGDDACSNGFSNNSHGGSWYPSEGSGDNSRTATTFANGPGFQGPRMQNGCGSQMNFQGSRWQGPRPQVLPRQEHFRGPVAPGFQGPRPQMSPGDFQGPRHQMAPNDFQGPRPQMGPGDFQGPRPQMGPGDFQGPRHQMGPGDFQKPRHQMASGDFQGPRPRMSLGDFQGPRHQMAPGAFQGPPPQMSPGDFQGPQPQMGPGDFQGPRHQMSPGNFKRTRPQIYPGDFRGPRPQMAPVSPLGSCDPPRQTSPNRGHFNGPFPQTYRGQGPPVPSNDFQQTVPPPRFQSSRPSRPSNNGPYAGQTPQMCQAPVPSVPPTNCPGPMPSSRQGPQMIQNGGYSSQMPNGPDPWMHNNGSDTNCVNNGFNKAGSCIPPQNEFLGPSNIGPVKNQLPNHRYNPVSNNRNS